MSDSHIAHNARSAETALGRLAALEETSRCLDANAPDVVVLQAGRNLTARVKMGDCDAVVKRFPKPSVFRRLLNAVTGHESKALCSYRAAVHLFTHTNGATPEPLAFFDAPDGTGFFATRFEANLEDFNAELRKTAFDANAQRALINHVAHACRAFHDSGFVHNDLGNQNIMLTPEGRVMLVDLNRHRLYARPLTPAERGRDLSRIYLPTEKMLEEFFAAYWGEDSISKKFSRAQNFARKYSQWSWATHKFRHPVKAYDEIQDWVKQCARNRALRWLERRARKLNAAAVPAPTPVANSKARTAFECTARAEAWACEKQTLLARGADILFVTLTQADGPAVRAEQIAALRDWRADGHRVAIALVPDSRKEIAHVARQEFALTTLAAISALEPVWCEWLPESNAIEGGRGALRLARKCWKDLITLRRRFPGIDFPAPCIRNCDAGAFAWGLRNLPAGLPDTPGCAVHVSDEIFRGRVVDVPAELRHLRALAVASPRKMRDRLWIAHLPTDRHANAVLSSGAATHVVLPL